MQLSPLSTCGSGWPAPWHSRQFIAGLWLAGSDALAWLGAPLWHVKHSLVWIGGWQPKQCVLSVPGNDPVWLTGRVDW